MDEAVWTIETYEASNTEKPVDDFIFRQQPQAKAKIAHVVKLLKQYGNQLGMPHSKALGSGMYELRIRGKEELRMFYFFTKGRRIYLLHAFKKQTRQTPKKELEIALQRMKNLTQT